MTCLLPPNYTDNIINIEPPKYNDIIHYLPSYEIIFPQNIEPIPIPIPMPIRSNVIVPTSVNSRATSQPLYIEFFSCNCLHNFIKCNKSIYNLLCCNIGCYKKNSPDTRCCGVCYYNCQLNENNYNRELDHREQCECCLPNLSDYCNSGYIITYSVVPENDCTWVCLPLKIPLFSSCFLGSLFNQSINYIRNTNTNYLF
jgi:hypothetical protein